MKWWKLSFLGSWQGGREIKVVDFRNVNVSSKEDSVVNLRQLVWGISQSLNDTS